MDPYTELRAALQAELDEPGPITKDEIRAVLAAHPPHSEGDFADADFSSDFA